LDVAEGNKGFTKVRPVYGMGFLPNQTSSTIWKLERRYEMYLRSYPALKIGYSEDEQWDTVPRALYATLEALSQGRIPNQNYTLDDLEALMKSLVQEQRKPGRFLVWGGSWSLIDIDEPAPSDVRVPGKTRVVSGDCTARKSARL
jgi:hypothetical protein